MEIAMTSKTKAVLAAVLIAAFATPALAQGQAGRLIEGRNAVTVHDFGTNGISTDRDSVVQSLGN
jgi:hypothetical protein